MGEKRKTLFLVRPNMQYSIVKHAETANSIFGYRLDAEFFQEIYLAVERQIKSKPHFLMSEVTTKIDVGFVGPMVHAYTDKGIFLLQTQNVKEFFIDDSSQLFIKEWFHDFLKKSKVKYGDVLLARSGSFGQASIYLEKEIVNSSDIIIVEAEEEKINKFYLVTFLNSEYGKNQLYRFASGGLQGHVNLTILENLRIPKLTAGFQTRIQNIVELAYHATKESKAKYCEAENMLLAELGLFNWKSKQKLSFVKKFSDTQTAGRIDAEYYQPIYEEIVKAIQSAKTCATLGDIVSIKKCVEPGSEAYQDSGIPFLRVSNLSKFGINNDNQQFISESLYNALKAHQPKEGEILLSKDASPGIAYYLNNNPDKMIPSSGILRLTMKNPDKVLPEYLTLVLNSLVVQKQIERDAGGSIINHWLIDQVKNALIPVLPLSTQKSIADKLSKSFSERGKSKRLLEIAKRGVEIAIEKDENNSQAWMKSELRTQKLSI